jgi:hypothetical protein
MLLRVAHQIGNLVRAFVPRSLWIYGSGERIDCHCVLPVKRRGVRLELPELNLARECREVWLSQSCCILREPRPSRYARRLLRTLQQRALEGSPYKFFLLRFAAPQTCSGPDQTPRRRLAGRSPSPQNGSSPCTSIPPVPPGAPSVQNTRRSANVSVSS